MLRATARIAIYAFAVGGAVAGCSSGGGSNASDLASKTSTQIPAAPIKNLATVDAAALFSQTCVGCHGEKGAGGKGGPPLAGKKVAEGTAVGVITNGKGRMPSFKSRLQPDQIAALAKYVSTL